MWGKIANYNDIKADPIHDTNLLGKITHQKKVSQKSRLMLENLWVTWGKSLPYFLGMSSYKCILVTSM